MKSTKGKKIQQLQKYISKSNIFWEKFESGNNIEIVIYPCFDEVGKFTEIVSEYLDSVIKPEEQKTNHLVSTMNIELLHYQVGIKMSDICKFYEINLNEIFT
jgi:hypothetical protein